MNYLQEVVGKLRSRIGEDALPPDHVDELLRIYAVLCLTVGEACSPQNVHDAWSAWMTGINPGHESVVPFDQLSQAVQLEDLPYLNAIHDVSVEVDSPAS